MIDAFAGALLSVLEIFARGGGGGSGGGGGGGGGSGGSGSGIGGFAAFGFFIMHCVTMVFGRFRKLGGPIGVIAQVISWMVCIAVCYLSFLVIKWWGIEFTLGAVAGTATGTYGVFGKIRQSDFVKRRLTQSAVQDSTWDETKLVEHATAVFMRYQEDWSKLDSTSMKSYMTESYHYKASLLIYILELMKRKDIMSDIKILQALITSANDEADNTRDSFEISFQASARDELVEAIDGSKIFTDTSTFTERWQFVRSGNTWLLNDIHQATESMTGLNASMRALAAQYNYCYSPDMGWLFIPKRGQLFGGARFGTSDINNHIVGLYNNSLLIQLYTYSKNPNDSPSSNYVIAQVNVPREYGNIVVRRKGRLANFGIKGLQKIETEWIQFNDKYDVYASSYEGVSSFELLNPTYMEQLEALPFKVSIEVVDNIIYLSTDERGTSIDTYTTMLDLAHKAFKELRL